MALESPKYKVIATFGDVELRDYETFYVAECTVPNVGELRDASSIAFNRLFGYISGRNSESQKIAMTTPVRQVPAADGWKVSFVVPRDIVARGVPKPSDVTIKIAEVPAAVYGVHRYRGFWNNEKLNDRASHLVSVLSENGYSTTGELVSAVYNPPMTPPPLRRNEVMVRVAKIA